MALRWLADRFSTLWRRAEAGESLVLIAIIKLAYAIVVLTPAATSRSYARAADFAPLALWSCAGVLAGTGLLAGLSYWHRQRIVISFAAASAVLFAAKAIVFAGSGSVTGATTYSLCAIASGLGVWRFARGRECLP